MLSLRRVCKTFNVGTVNEKNAVNDLTLELDEGDFLTVIGGNGSGKSTTLNLVAGVFPVDSGSISIGGTDVTRQREHQRAGLLGRVFQDPMQGTAANMTIEENLALALRRGKRRSLSWGIGSGERARFREALSELELGLENRLGTKVGLLSGGQRQALTLLMATLERPKLLLLDEHTAALDPKTAHKVLELSDRIISHGRLTTLMVTHNMKDAITYGNRLIMMSDGKVVFDARDEEKRNLTVAGMIDKFSEVSGIMDAGNLQ